MRTEIEAKLRFYLKLHFPLSLSSSLLPFTLLLFFPHHSSFLYQFLLKHLKSSVFSVLRVSAVTENRTGTWMWARGWAGK